jgi:hypothetical protein
VSPFSCKKKNDSKDRKPEDPFARQEAEAPTSPCAQFNRSTAEARIVDLISKLHREDGLSVVMVTHHFERVRLQHVGNRDALRPGPQ